MASLAQQPPQKQQGNQIPPDISPNVAGVVEVFADQLQFYMAPRYPSPLKHNLLLV